MTLPDGGLRDRYIRESVFEAVQADLTTIGWFGGGRDHKPIQMIYGYPENFEEQPVSINTIAVSVGDQDPEPTEMGSSAWNKDWAFFFDFYAENDSVGLQVVGDIQEFLMKAGTIDVKDYQDVGDPVVGYVEVNQDANTRKVVRRVTQPWQRYWWVCSVTVTDGGR